ncbi:S1 family peptidase [Phytoactinopolyspora mesophila]|uniref:Peptidase S1 domain-containing protein n=1 Tax=Phytoactinopolyspora mesophila TaxID=2650750 RepID=A0A7K3M9I5_9ACTN|nr:S1 family peptidase [Phytoactinopolyspora mesophila]NDL59985.1 hypothetical protein [Phytoactinopolyspora mesophila]
MARAAVRRMPAALVASCLVSAGLFGGIAPATAEDALLDIGLGLQTYEPSEFRAEALELPAGLRIAVERDLGVPAERYLADAAAGQSAAHVVDALRAGGADVGAAVFDRATQTLEIFSADPGDYPAIEAAGAVVLPAAPPEPDLDAAVIPHEERFKGGYGYGEPDGAGGLHSYCTAGFNGHGADGSAVALSAGHCFPRAGEDTRWAHVDIDEPWTADTPGWPSPGAPLGRGVGGAWLFGNGHDVGLLNVDDAAWTPVPVITTWGGGSGDPRRGEVTLTDHVSPVVGQPVCRSGVTSGYQCGEVTAVDHLVDYGEAHGHAAVTGFTTSACSSPGDSGGPYVSGTAAVGILSGAAGPASGLCDHWDPDTNFSFAYALAGGAHSAESFYRDGEWELAVAVSEPAVSLPLEVEAGEPLVVSGVVDRAGPNHWVSVAVYGRTHMGAVTAGGRFSVRVHHDLPAGTTHPVTVRAHYGRHSVSEPASGSVSVTGSQDGDREDHPVVPGACATSGSAGLGGHDGAGLDEVAVMCRRLAR